MLVRKIQVVGHQKTAKDAKRRPNLCPPHDIILATPMPPSIVACASNPWCDIV